LSGSDVHEVDARTGHANENFTSARNRTRYVDALEDLRTAIALDANRLHADARSSALRPERLASATPDACP
jgi:hypothetical protein